MEFHYPVLLSAVEHYWIHKACGLYVDATLGGGGYEKEFLHRYGSGLRVIGVDLDYDALSFAKSSLQDFDQQVTFCHGNFRDLTQILGGLGVEKVDGILLDLGTSSYLLDTPQRGFSYRTTGPLDMRFDASKGVMAKEIVAKHGAKELADIFWRFGEERLSRRIARAIVRYREKQQIETTTELADIIRSAVPTRNAVKTLSRCFQALRAKVNDEYESLSSALRQVPSLLNAGGRLVVISYESISDRITKEFIVQEQKGCTCPPTLPQCVCGRKPTMKILTRRPITPSIDEVKKNRRARGAKLRSCQRSADS